MTEKRLLKPAQLKDANIYIYKLTVTRVGIVRRPVWKIYFMKYVSVDISTSDIDEKLVFGASKKSIEKGGFDKADIHFSLIEILIEFKFGRCSRFWLFQV